MNSISGTYRLMRTAVILTLFLLSFGFAVSGCDYLSPSPEATITVPDEIDCGDDVNTFTSGADIYFCKCAKCHGIDGESITPEITDIRRFDDHEEFIESLDNGPAEMPAYPEIDSDHRELLYLYVRDSLGS